MTGLHAPADSTGQTVTFYNYDASGHVWRTNAKTGVVTVMLYDLQGFQTATITSAGGTGGADLGAAGTTPWSVDGSSVGSANGYARTDVEVDLLGRVLYQTLALRPNAQGDLYRPEVDQSFDRWGNMTSQTAPYDHQASLHHQLNAQILSTDYVYDYENKLVEEIQPNDQGVTSLPQAAAPVLADTLYGTGGSDVFDSHGQAHTIIANGGGNSFVYQRGYGQLTISQWQGDGSNTLAFGAGIDPQNIVATVASNGNLILTLSGTDQVVLVNQGSASAPSWAVRTVTFADDPGASWSPQQLAAGGGAAAAPATGMTSAVVNGVQTYQYQAGDGAATISYLSGQAVLDFTDGTLPSDVSVSTPDGSTLVLSLSATDTISVTDGFTGSDWPYYLTSGLSAVRFSDGTVWTLQHMQQLAQTSSSLNRTLYAAGSSTFTYTAGSGAVTIENTAYQASDVLKLGPGIAPASVAVTASANGQDLILSMGSSDQVTIAYGYSGADSVYSWGYGISAVEFADGTVWSMAQVKAMAETAQSGNTVLWGTGVAGGDSFTYTAGAGAVWIGEFAQAATLVVEDSVDPAKLSVSASGQDLVLWFSPTDRITLAGAYASSSANGVQSVAFAGGPSWSLAQLRALAAAAPGGTTHVAAASGAEAGTGQPVFQYAAGSGAVPLADGNGLGVLQLGPDILPRDLAVSAATGGADLVLALSASDRVTIANGMIAGHGIRAVRFSNGYVLTMAQLKAMADTATAQNTDLWGSFGQDSAFVYNQGAGAATIDFAWNSSEVDTLQLNGILPDGASISSPDGQDLVLRLSATDSITIKDGYSMLAVGRGIQSITFADGTVWSGSHIKALLTGAATAPGGAPAGAGAGSSDASPVTRFAYDADGQQIAATDANGHTTSQVWNADGELAEVIHADGGKITYSYDAFGDQVQVNTLVGYTTNGSNKAVPVIDTTDYAYDGLGRQTEMIQAPVEVNTDDGTADPVNGDQLSTFNIVTLTTYDSLGDRLVQQVGAVNMSTVSGGVGHVTTANFADGYTQTSDSYDLRGNLIAATAAQTSANIALGSASLVAAVTDYNYNDQGRETYEQDANARSGQFGAQALTWAYNAFGQLTQHTDLAGNVDTYQYDQAGRLVTSLSQYNGATIAEQTYTYDGAGDLLQEVDTGAGNVLQSPDSADGFYSGAPPSNANGQESIYSYDASGRRVLEETAQINPDKTLNAVQYQGLTYDTLGRLIEVKTPILDETIQYDNVGNKMFEGVAQVNSDGTETTIQDLYFEYNDMNQQIMADGSAAYDVLDPTQSIQTSGHLLGYDLAGNRITDTTMGVEVAQDPKTFYQGPTPPRGVINPNPDGSDVLIKYTGPSSDGDQTATGPGIGKDGIYYTEKGLVTQYYGYDAENRLVDVATDEMKVQSNGNVITGMTADGSYSDLENRYYDAEGRVVGDGPDVSVPNYTQYITAISDKNSNFPGASSTFTTYDGLGRVEQTKQNSFLERQTATNTITNYSYDNVGNVTGYTTYETPTAGGATIANETYTIAFETSRAPGQRGAGDSYQQYSVTETANLDNAGTSPSNGTTTDVYDADGNLVYVDEVLQQQSGTTEEDRALINDASGHVLSNQDKSYTLDDNNSPTLTANNQTGELVVNGAATATYGWDGNGKIHGTFDLAFAPVSATNPAPSGGQYQVQAGDTLETIAQAAYGDASLWYLIADANGLSSDQDLKVAETLTIPTVTGDIHNTAGTVAPYDPTKIVGNTTPNVALPTPPAASQGCGAIGEIIMLVVLVVVTVLTAGAAAIADGAVAATEGAAGAVSLGTASLGTVFEAGLSTLAGGITVGGVTAGVTTLGAVAIGAVAGAVGSIVSQGVGIAIGQQRDFNWGEVAESAIGTGITAGVGTALAPADSPIFAGADWPAVAGRAAIGAALSQGVDVAVGLQKNFSWQAVAGAAAGAAVGARLGTVNFTDSALANGLIAGTAGGIAGGVAASAFNGGRVDLGNIATDAFGNALGSSLAENDWSGGSSNASQPYTVTSEEAGPTVALPSVDFGGSASSPNFNVGGFLSGSSSGSQDGNGSWRNFDAQSGSMLEDGKIMGDLGSVPSYSGVVGAVTGLANGIGRFIGTTGTGLEQVGTGLGYAALDLQGAGLTAAGVLGTGWSNPQPGRLQFLDDAIRSNLNQAATGLQNGDIPSYYGHWLLAGTANFGQEVAQFEYGVGRYEFDSDYRAQINSQLVGALPTAQDVFSENGPSGILKGIGNTAWAIVSPAAVDSNFITAAGLDLYDRYVGGVQQPTNGLTALNNLTDLTSAPFPASNPAEQRVINGTTLALVAPALAVGEIVGAPVDATSLRAAAGLDLEPIGSLSSGIDPGAIYRTLIPGGGGIGVVESLDGSEIGAAPDSAAGELQTSGLSVVPRPGMTSLVVLDSDGNPVTIYGQAERSSSTTPGHAEAMNDLADSLAQSGDYESITLQRSWRTATGRVGTSGDIPDVIGVGRNGVVDAWEVQSATDNYDALLSRLNAGRASLPSVNRGEIYVIPPKPPGL